MCKIDLSQPIEILYKHQTMNDFDIEYTSLRLTINSIQCRILQNELHDIHEKLNIVEQMIVENPPTVECLLNEECQLPTEDPETTYNNSVVFCPRKKRRIK